MFTKCFKVDNSALWTRSVSQGSV